MITGELKNQIDRIWDAFWSGGIANPLEVMEQITYLLFIKRLDDLQILEENRANRTGKPIARRIFPEGVTEKGVSYEGLRWSRFRDFESGEMFRTVSDGVFPFIRSMNDDVEHSTYSHHMKDARFTIPTANLLSRVVDMLDHIPMDDRDTQGDLYEYMLGKIASAGQNGQFRTPRHIIRMMVELLRPMPDDILCDPAFGTAGFLIGTAEYLHRTHPEIFLNEKTRAHFNSTLFNGFDFDHTMLRIGSMNLLLHGIENPNIVYKDSLSEDHSADEEQYTLIFANPPFAGSLD